MLGRNVLKANFERKVYGNVLKSNFEKRVYGNKYIGRKKQRLKVAYVGGKGVK